MIAVGNLRDEDRNREQSLQQETPHEVMVALSPINRMIAVVFLGIRQQVSGWDPMVS